MGPRRTSPRAETSKEERPRKRAVGIQVLESNWAEPGLLRFWMSPRDGERVAFVVIDPEAGQGLDNVALVCGRCRRDHADWPQPIPGSDE